MSRPIAQALKDAEECRLQAEVHRVVVKHVRRETPAPAIALILADEKKTLLVTKLLKAHLALVNSRSLNFADCQVTLYDQALLKVTVNGQDLTCTPAISLFAEEILGITTPEVLALGKATGGVTDFKEEIAGHGLDMAEFGIIYPTTMNGAVHG